MMLTKNLSLAELESHDGTPVPDDKMGAARKVAALFQKIRDRWGRPVVVISGYRHPAYNYRVGGAEGSTHMFEGGDGGIDIRPVSMADVPELIRLIDEMHADGDLPDMGGFGKYRGWAHVDTRKASDGHLRRWYGRGVGSEPSSHRPSGAY